MKFSNYFILLLVIIILSTLQVQLLGENAQEAKEINVWLNTGKIIPNFTTLNKGQPFSVDFHKYQESKDLRFKFLNPDGSEIEITLVNLQNKSLIKPNLFSILVDREGRLEDFPTQKILFPFGLEVTYDGRTFQSDKIGKSDKELLKFKPSKIPAILEEAHPYYDALVLNNIKNKEVNKVMAVLEKYLSDKDKTLTTEIDPDETIEDLMKKFKDNPYITEYLIRVKSQRRAAGVQSMATIEKTKIDKEKAGGIGISKITDGIAKFLVARAKEELSIAFFQKFKNKIKGDEYKIYQNLFPETFKLLEIIDEEIYKFSSYIQALREAFEKDLSNSFDNLPKLLTELMKVPKIENFLISNPWLKLTLMSGLYIIDGIKKEKHPGEIIAEFNTSKFSGEKLQNLKGAIELLKIISDSLRVKNSNNRYWIKMDSLNKLFEKDKCGNYVIFKIYLGLIYSRSKINNIQFKIKNRTVAFSDMLKRLNKILPTNEIEKIRTLIENLLFKTNHLENTLNDLNRLKQNAKRPTYSEYYKFFNSALDTFEYSIDLYVHVHEKLNPDLLRSNSVSNVGSELSEYFDVARALGDIYLDVNQRNYTSVIFNIIKLLDKTLEPILGEKYNNIRADILKYGTFMAAVANAQNSNEVKEAIETAVLPAGSSAIKRNSKFNIALNTYVGFALGIDKRIENENSGTEQPPITFGTPSDRFATSVFAPIGVTVSWGIKRCFIGSFSFFVTALDLGALTALRFNDNETETLPKFTIGNVVAPGLYMVLGFRNSPISFGGGFQYGPQLRKITLSNVGNELELTISSWRFNLFLAVDIPLLNFHSR
jgi:hypothetical protein